MLSQLFCILTDVFNCVNFHHLTLASQIQFSFVLMDSLNNSWKCTGVLQCLYSKIYTGNPGIYCGREDTTVLVFCFSPV